MKIKKKYLIISLLFFLTFDKIQSQELKGEEIYAKINNAIVTIYTFDAFGKPLSQGSGVVLNSKGWIVTNYHVFAGAEKLVVKNKDKIVEYSSIVGLDVEKDILILKISQNTFQSIKIGNSDLLKIGQKVYAIGSPLGFENTITEGIISGLRYYKKETKKFIQISAPISHGSSGGAILNEKGELIGISTSSIIEGQNLNFAIPVNDVLAVYNQEGIKQDQINAAVFFYRGIYEFDKQNYEGAIENYKKSISLFPNSAGAYYNLGLAYGENDDIEQEIISYKKAIAINSDFADAYYNLGVAFGKRKDFDTAIFYLKKTVILNPKDFEATASLGAAYTGKGDDQNAIFYLKKSIGTNSENGPAYRLLGNIYANRKEYDIAISYLQQATKIDSEDAGSLYLLGVIYSLKGDEKLEKFFKERAFKIDPSLKE